MEIMIRRVRGQLVDCFLTTDLRVDRRLPFLLHVVHHCQVGNTAANDEEPELARWLEESGRRKVKPEWLAALYAEEAQPVQTLPPRQPYMTQPALLWLLGFAALAYLQYVFIDAQLQVVSMHTVVFFVAK